MNTEIKIKIVGHALLLSLVLRMVDEFIRF